MSATTMTLGKLAALIHKVDQRHKGCSVQITTINTTQHSTSGEIYGIVTIGMRDYKRIFHNEEELHEILTHYAEK